MEAVPHIKQAVEKGVESKTQDTRAAIASFGQMCSVEQVLSFNQTYNLAVE